MKLSVNELDAFILKTLQRRFSAEHSALMKDVILFAELSGQRSHGILRLVPKHFSPFDETCDAEPEVLSKSAFASFIEGHNNPGMLLGGLALRELFRLAGSQGLGLVGTRGSNSTSGCFAYYAHALASRGLIGIMIANGGKIVTTFGGIERLFGTNPLAIGVPTPDGPLILDMSTSAISNGELMHRADLGQSIPENAALDCEGQGTTDPKAALKGAILPFAGHYKSAGLALMIEILAGALTGASTCGVNAERGWGNLFCAISPDVFGGGPDFSENIAGLLNTVLSSKTADGEKIRLPGKESQQRRELALKTGEVEVDESIFTSAG